MNLVCLLLIGLLSLKDNNILETQDDEVQQVSFAQATGNYANQEFISTYRIPSSELTYTSSGDLEPQGDRTFGIANAFDDDLTTYWVAKQESKDGASSHIIISYKTPITVQAFLYDGNYFTHDPHRDFYGFPLVMTVYTSTAGSEFKKVAVFSSNRKPGKPWERIQFPLNKPITGDKIKLEFNQCTENYYFTPNNNTNALIANLILIQGLTDEYNQLLNEVESLFTDYCEFELIKTYTKEKAKELRTRALKFNTFNLYDTFLKPTLDRAESVFAGKIRKDPYFEFSTKPGSKNQIHQYGDLAGYTRQQLLVSWYGTNKQATGIGGVTGRKFTIYVDVEPFEGYQKSDVQLPRIGYSQSYGTWNFGMNDGPINLGKNPRVYHDFLVHGGITVPVEGGGAMYILNTYTSEAQKGHVTIYFDGCYKFPIFHKGDDEESFKVILSDYYNRLQDPNDDEIVIDVYETQGDYVLISALATTAYDYYVVNKISPKENVENWDHLFKSLLAFGGVQFNEGEPLYNVNNNHIWENVRVVQPYAGMYAYACDSMIGLPSQDTHHNLYKINKPGWAVSHEFGHTVDKRGRTWAENSNNMWAIYNVFHINGEVTNRNGMQFVSQNLASDLSDYVTHKDGKGLMDNDYVVWWYLEASHPGYWAKFENLFITETSDKDEKGKTILDVAERTIYYSCLALGENLTEHFDRWGYYYAGDPVFTKENRFTYKKSSDNFKNLLNKALADGRIANTYKKAWYIDLDFFNYLNKHDWKLGDWAHCYSESDKIKPVSFAKTTSNDGYIIYLPEFKNKEAHLCYEIQSLINNEWKVIGITYTTSFTDTYNYGNAKPTYKVYGYDKNLDHTGNPGEGTVPEIKPVEPVVQVCRIGDTYYDTIPEAINAASDEDTILLCKSVVLTDNININKPITIMPDEGLTDPIVITKTKAGNLIGISSNNVKFGSKDRVKIILDGGSFQQAGTIIRTGNQEITIENTVLRNNYNNEEGGGVFLGQNGKVTMIGCTIENCRASHGGGINTRGGGVGSTHIILEDVLIKNNTATSNDGKGGGIWNSGVNGHSSVISTKGLIIENNTAKFGGGVYNIMNTELTNAIIRKNTAEKHGGGVYVDCSPNEEQRYFRVNNAQIIDNSDSEGDTAVYVNSGPFLINGGKFSGRIQLTDTGSMQLLDWSDALQPTVPDFSTATFIVELSDEGVILFTNVAEGFQLSNPLTGFNVLNGYCSLQDDRSIKAYFGKAIINIKASDGKNYKLEIPYSDFVFTETFEGFPEDYFITEWNLNDKTYNIGDTLYVNHDYTFEITVQKYCLIKLVYIDNVQIVRVKSGTNYYMPTATPDGKRVYGWNSDDGNYYLYAQKVFVTSDLIFTPIFQNAITLAVRYGKNALVFAGEQDFPYTLPPVTEPFNDEDFKYWIVDNEKHKSGDKITIYKTTTCIAYYLTTFDVTYVKGQNKEVVEYPKNALITLANPGPLDDNNVFLYWQIDGNRYYINSTLNINSKMTIEAHYGPVDKAQKISVSYIVKAVNEEPPYRITGNDTQTHQFNYLDNLILPSENDFHIVDNRCIGYDGAVGRRLFFSHWEINGVRYESSSVISVTEPFEAVLISIPYKPPKSIEIEEVRINSGVIETSSFIKDIEYLVKVSLNHIYINGDGHDNLYLSINVDNEDDVNIQKTNAKFGVKVDSNSKDKAIRLNQENPKMNIKGNGTLTLKASNSIKSLSLNDATVSNDEKLNVHLDAKIATLMFNTLNMYGNSEFNSGSLDDKKTAKVDTITIFEGANSKMLNVEATNKIILELNAFLSLSNVDISQAKQMIINYHDLISSSEPIITGNLTKPPLEISLVQQQQQQQKDKGSIHQNAALLLEEKLLQIASASEDDFDQCEDWIPVVKIENTHFTQVECRKVGDNKVLVAFAPDNSKGKGNKTRLIVGVVVAVVVVIAIVVVVVIFVIRKKNSYQNTSDAEVNETRNDINITNDNENYDI